ncbi:DNA-binding protein, YbaB/EbfC family [Candidatus Regiella insecticola 5.15]|uniref:Nucleoid-associated protein Rin_00012650 n=1 Tax=Candidatus Regiella insecticola 5.15 TaxID=1005043 RepID=G2GZN9_9ENTR|nr:YbaB/EbfC family nucleoid-associated protein [Candidatus Regiella insecticola]EGY28796.1 DNA-binding protein, YbaB/EbfC family [Candidatus Regiella insecticola 5.15]
MVDLGDMASAIKDAQKNIEKIQAEIQQAEATGESGGGDVKVTINGTYKCLDISIDPSLITNLITGEIGKEVLEDLIRVAYNNAVEKIAAIQKEKLGVISNVFQSGFKMQA